MKYIFDRTDSSFDCDVTCPTEVTLPLDLERKCVVLDLLVPFLGLQNTKLLNINP